MTLDCPFPWFGGKRRVATEVWARFGDCPNYVEPFFGSGAVLLGRPDVDLDDLPLETVNDADAFVCNLWRAMQADPEGVAEHADRMVNESDLHAAHIYLREQRETLRARCEADLAYHDSRIAGLWVWGQCIWIGGGWCGPFGAGPWQVVDGQLVKSDAGQGVARQLPHLGNAGVGVQRRRPHLGDAGKGVQRKSCGPLVDWFGALAARMRRVRVCCGDWTRVMGESVTVKHGTTGVFLDPPYSAEAGRDMGCYSVDSGDVAHAVRGWCLANGANPLLRIALCGYAGEGHEPLEDAGWTSFAWKAAGGYSNQGNGAGRENAHRERIWFSPACIMPGEDEGLLGERT